MGLGVLHWRALEPTLARRPHAAHRGFSAN
jgi:hypothetical protein